MTLRAFMVLLHPLSFGADRLRVGKRVSRPTSGLERNSQISVLWRRRGDSNPRYGVTRITV
jgi:hypothetical protein